MAIVASNPQSAFASGASVPSISSYAVSGVNTLLIVGVGTDVLGSPPTDLGASLSSQGAMTAAGAMLVNSGVLYSKLFYKINPTTGQNITTSRTGGSAQQGMTVGAILFTGVDQTTGVRTETTIQTSGTSVTTTASTATAGDAIVDFMIARYTSTGSATPGADQVEQIDRTDLDSGFAYLNFALSTQDPISDKVMSWGTSQSGSINQHAIPIIPVASLSRPVPRSILVTPSMQRALR